MVTNVYVINANKHIFVIDTYLGPEVMSKVNDYLVANFAHKPIIVINTHNHYDHVWGNCFYSHSLIIAHSNCLKQMKEDGLDQLQKYPHLLKGDVILTYPNLTFDSLIRFEEDEIDIYYTPGHSDDSISIIDYHDKVLFAGDNIEEPYPFLEKKDVPIYVKTLMNYLQLDINIVIGGHSSVSNKDLIKKNIESVQRL